MKRSCDAPLCLFMIHLFKCIEDKTESRLSDSRLDACSLLALELSFLKFCNIVSAQLDDLVGYRD